MSRNRAYEHPEYLAFVRQMRKSPDDSLLPMIVADWLDEHDKPEHAKYIRLWHHSHSGRVLPWDQDYLEKRNLDQILTDNIHSWTAGAARTNDSRVQWSHVHTPKGFFSVWTIPAMKEGSDRERNESSFLRLSALILRQPIRKCYLELPEMTFQAPREILKAWAQWFPRIAFQHRTHIETCTDLGWEE